MKSIVKIASIAVAAMALTVACKNAPEAVEDTTPIDTTPIEEVVEDTMPMIDTVEVAPVETTKPVAKKATTKKATAKQDNTEVTVTTITTKEGETILKASGERPSGKLTLQNKKTGEEKSMKVLN